jgi:hypothetical protein
MRSPSPRKHKKSKKDKGKDKGKKGFKATDLAIAGLAGALVGGVGTGVALDPSRIGSNQQADKLLKDLQRAERDAAFARERADQLSVELQAEKMRPKATGDTASLGKVVEQLTDALVAAGVWTKAEAEKAIEDAKA